MTTVAASSGTHVVIKRPWYQTWPVDFYPDNSLRSRLFLYRSWIKDGEAVDLADAVKFNAELWRRWHRQTPSRVREQWRRRVAAKENRQYRYNRAIVLASGKPCTYCGSPDAGQADHVVPRARGGTHDLSNLVPACMPCNSQKRNRTVAEWRARRLERGQCWPPVHEARAAA